MATSAVGLWAHKGSYAEILEFRRNPSLYLNTRKISEETFAHYILQALCQDTVPANIKIHLLNDLQEYATTILPSTTSAEEIVASLLDIFRQSINDGASIFRGQVLVSATSITVQFDLNVERVEQFVKLVETLLEVACHQSTAADAHLQIIACSCLQELETCLPCMLQNKLEYVYQLAQMERGPAAQGYLVLLVTILQHALGLLRFQEPASLPSNALATLLTDRTEPLKPYVMPNATSNCLMTQKITKSYPLVGVDLTEMRRLVAFVVDYAPLLTTTGQVYVLFTLGQIVKEIPEISPAMFKHVIIRNTRSFDMGYISLLMSLQDGFGASLVGVTDTSVLFRSIVTATAHPGVSPAQRFLLMEWLTELTQVGEDPGWPGLISFTLLTRIFPRTFDGCELQLKKLYLLSRLLPNYLPDDEVEEALCSCLQLIQQSVQCGLGGRPATVLFRSLYRFYQHIPDYQAVESIKWILIRLGQNHSWLALRVLNLVEATQRLQPDSDLGQEVLLSLLTSITMVTPSGQDPVRIQHHLVVLHRIASEPSVNPTEIVSYLQKLVAMDTICCYGDWETGSRILNVCRSLLAQHNINEIFASLGHVLHRVSVQHADVDIRDRAAFYYTLLCTLSPQKVTSLLSLAPGGRDTLGLAVMVSQTSSMSGVRPVHRLQQPLLRLTRIEHENELSVLTVEPEETGTGMLENYYLHLENNAELGRIAIDFYLHFDNESTEDLDELFALELHFNSSPFYKTIPDMHISWVKRSESACPGPDCSHIRLNLEPSVSVPVTLSPEGVFTTRDGRTWRTPVVGVDINLEDLWRPLPVSPDHARTLYKLLWASMVEKRDSLDGPIETVLCLNLDLQVLSDLMSERWQSLLIDTDTVLSTVAETFTPKWLLTSHEATSGKELRHLAMFLPPKHHVLLELLSSKDRTVVSIATDHIEVLPILTEYLRAFEKHEE